MTDRYATLLGERFYRELAIAARPDVVAALSEARRQVEAARVALPAGSRDASLVEWATPAVFVRGEPMPLYNPADGMDDVTPEPPAPVLADGVPLRAVGDFVGRRSEIRTLLRALRGERAGVLIHGIGGVGKSTLAAELLRLLGEDAGLVVSVVGATGPDQILDWVGQAVFHAALAAELPETHPLRQLAGYLRAPGQPWAERLAAAVQLLLAAMPVTLLVDNFETNLATAVGGESRLLDDQLGLFLTAWIRAPGGGRLVMTSRYPFALPDDAHRRLSVHHLGPLSWAETRKLLWRLPALDLLSTSEQLRAYADVGGHPRTLEYLDALLRRGQAKFPDVSERIEALLARRGIDRPDRWIAELHRHEDGAADGIFDRALSEAVTLTVNDTLLHDLLALLDEPARNLLVAVAVYRRPADEIAVAWQLAERIDPPPDAARDQRLAEYQQATQDAEARGGSVSLEDLGYSQEQAAQLADDVAALRRPPLGAIEDPAPAIRMLERLGLLTPVIDPDADPMDRVAVHRWTAASLARLYPESTRTARTRAAGYHTWRVDTVPQDRVHDVEDLLEVRYHYHAAGDLEQAVSTSYTVRDQLDAWAAWDWEARICQETLTWVPDDSRDAYAFTLQLGNLAQKRGDYDTAVEIYQHILPIQEQVLGAHHPDTLGTRNNLALAYQETGRHPEAIEIYQHILPIREQVLGAHHPDTLGTRNNLAIAYQAVGRYPEAIEIYQHILPIQEQVLGAHHPNTLNTRNNLANAYQETGRYPEAIEIYQHNLRVRLEISSPEVRIDLYWLRRQRDELGVEAFVEILRQHLDQDSIDNLMSALDPTGEEAD